MTDESRLRFDVSWASALPTGDSESATVGSATLWVGKELVWGAGDDGAVRPISWSWVDLLEHLSSCWTFMLFERTDPFSIDSLTPATLRRDLTVDWGFRRKAGALTETGQRMQEDELMAYELRHDLGRGLKGLKVPPLFIVPDESVLVFATLKRACRVSRIRAIADLAEIGDQIAARLVSLGDDEAIQLVSDWRNRDPHPTVDMIAMGTGLRKAKVEQLAGNSSPATFWNAGTTLYQDSSLQAAARLMPDSLSDFQVLSILDAVRSAQAVATSAVQPKLEEISQDAIKKLNGDLAVKADYEQGYALARWMRQRLDLKAKPADPEALLADWGVPIIARDFLGDLPEAMACWGPNHSPCIVVNSGAARTVKPATRRAILAHEICHLLVDRHDALPFVEIKKGRTAPALERRAGAFAAELLIPQRDAVQAIGKNKPSLMEAMRQLADSWGVSYEIIAWQIRNGGGLQKLSRDDRDSLSQLVSEPSLF